MQTKRFIKPILKAIEGEIAQAGQAVGVKKALAKMSEMIVDKMVKEGDICINNH